MIFARLSCGDINRLQYKFYPLVYLWVCLFILHWLQTWKQKSDNKTKLVQLFTKA